MKPLMYFGALVAGVRILWLDPEKAQCLCPCGALFYRHRACLRRRHVRGKVTMCFNCLGPSRVLRAKKASLIGNEARWGHRRRAA